MIMVIFKKWHYCWCFLVVIVVVFTTFGSVEGTFTNGRFQFTQAVYSTTEDFGVASITVQRSLGSDGRAAVYVSTIPGVGNAVAGRDYKPIFNMSLVWQDGEDFEKALNVPIYNDGKPQESPKTFTLRLHDALGAVINTDRNETQVVLVPPTNIVPGSFTFKDATMTTNEGRLLIIPVVWVAGSTSRASVKFEIVCKTACFPDDFELISPTTKLLEWKRDDYPAPVTSRTQNITLKVPHDGLYELSENFIIRLIVVEAAEAVVGTGTIGNIGEMVVSITGPNDARPGSIQFHADCFPDCASTKYSAVAGGAALVLIQRRNGTDRDCSVIVATQDDTAIAGVDYIPLEQQLFWKEGDTSERNVIVTSIFRADPRLPPRRIALVLRSNTEASLSGVHASTTYVDITSPTDVFLGDVNFATREPLESVLRAPDLSFIPLASRNTSSRLQLCPSVVATEPGVLSVPIQRNFAAFPVPAQVIVKTVAGTAISGVDFEPLTNTIVSWENDASDVKYVFLKLLTPSTYDPSPRSLWLQLSAVYGAKIGDCNALEVVLVGLAQGPRVVSFSLDLALGKLTLQMSHPVQVSTLDVTKLLLQSEHKLKSGPSFKFTTQHTTTNSPDGSVIILNIVTEDLNNLKRTVGLGKSASSSFLSTEVGLFQYVLNSCQSTGIHACSPAKTISISNASALAITTFIADTVAPTLVGYSLDLPRRLLKLHFSEAVNFSTLQIQSLTFSETIAGIDVYRLSPATTQLFAPQPDPLSGATLRDTNRLPADYTFLTLQLGQVDVTALTSFGSGKIGITRANTFLGMESSFIADFSRNSVTALSPGGLLQVSAADCSSCPAGSYLTSSCSDLKDRKCTICSVCPSNSFAIETCRATEDTLCYPCTECRGVEFASVACSPMTDRVCSPCTPCTLDEYEVSPCAAGVDRICRTCNSCTLTTAQQVLCQRSPMWKRLQMRSPFSCPQPSQEFKTREEQLQRAKSNRCGSGRCSCTATGVAGNSNPIGEGFPDDPRCTGPVVYNILV